MGVLGLNDKPVYVNQRLEAAYVTQAIRSLLARRALPVAQIIAIIAAIIPLFKKKPFCLWHWQGPRPTDWKKYGPFSKRQCKKTMKKLVDMGCNPAHFAIFRPGVTPPPYQGDE